VTGDLLPSGLQHRIESLSGVTMERVRVHRDSPLPPEIGALAFAEGSTIHLGPGQEAHLAHEAWHVAQQRRGVVAPTRHLHGRPINDDPMLEREAETMGSRAQAGIAGPRRDGLRRALHAAPVLQGVFPDAHNEQRRKEQSISVVQLDHIVPGDAAGVCAGARDARKPRRRPGNALGGHARSGGSPAHEPREAAPDEGVCSRSEAQLINLPENIVPGRLDQLQGAKNRFDPQVALGQRGARGQNLDETALSRSLRPMDVAIRQLNQIVDKDALPIKPSERTNAKRYDSETDELFASAGADHRGPLRDGGRHRTAV